MNERFVSRSPRSRERGFSLAEVLVAVALLAVIILAVFGLVSAGIKQAYGGKKMTEATIAAQTVMERANIQKPQAALGAADTDSVMTVSWNKTRPGVGSANDSYTTLDDPASDAATNPDAWRVILRDTDLPASTAKPAELTVKMEAVPAGKNFGNCSMVRITVDVEWVEYGVRERIVRLQSLNLKVIPNA